MAFRLPAELANHGSGNCDIARIMFPQQTAYLCAYRVAEACGGIHERCWRHTPGGSVAA
jgi:hypothetical protein